MTHAHGDDKRLQEARQTRPQHATPRRLQKARAPLQRAQARAQRRLQALEQAFEELGWPERIGAESPGQRKAHTQLWGNICGLMCPTVFGCRTTAELARVRVWDNNLPGQILSALPKRKWVRPLPRVGQELLVTVWRQGEGKSPAPRSRWPWTWVGADRVCTKAGPHGGRVGTWWSGQEPRVRRGIDGLRLVVVIGNGTRVIPVDCTMRRPDPGGPGRPCHDQRTWLQVMRERTWRAWPRRRLRLPAPLIIADRWCGDSKLRAPVALRLHGTWLVAGTSREVFQWSDGRRVTGQALLPWPHWPWRDCLWLPGRRYARVTATSPTSGPVTVVIVEKPGEARDALRCHATTLTALRLIQAWKRRSWSEHHVRTLTQLWAAEACQVHGADAYDGHRVWRLLASLVRFAATRRLCKGRVTMEAMGFSLKHHGRFLDSERLA